MKKIAASLLLALTLLSLRADDQTANPDRATIILWHELAAAVEDCLLWHMPNEDAESSLLLGPEDEFYLSPTQTQIDAMVAFALAHQEWTPYVEEAWDCDNWAREFKYWADVWSLRHLRARAGLTVAVAYVRLEGDISELFPGEYDVPLVYHAMITIRRNDGQWFFLEPQNGCVVPVDGLLCLGSVKVLKINL